jgi:UDP-N-acetylglucosamine--N-acetylmuramyl-(pentapeptide) pyrophosphoryl-undecaprenol N-acetylglucosamine transferase
LHEQTSSIGLTNKLLQGLANFIGVTFDASVPYFKKPVTVVGSPTMVHIYSINTFDELQDYLKKEKSKLLEDQPYLGKLAWIEKEKKHRKVILMSGGSQGSHFLNEKLKEILPELLAKRIVIVQLGENEWYNDYQVWSDYVATLPSDLAQYCVIRKFVYEEYGYLMKQADLFVARSGANTVYQAGMNGLFSIFVPIPWVTKNEQFTNAVILRDKGFATIIDQANCTPKRLLDEINEELDANKTGNKGTIVFPHDADQRLATAISVLAIQ